MTELGKKWWVYLVKCADESLYCGVTIDTKRRVQEHNLDDKKGAKYTKVRRPVELVYKQTCLNRSEACKEEARIKKLSRKQKIELIKADAL